MARELIIQAWCDLCVPHGDRTPSVASHVLSLDGVTRELDLCDSHLAVIAEVAELLHLGTEPDTRPAGAGSKRGRPGGVVTMPGGVKADSTSEVARTCPECRAVSPTRSAMLGHLGNMHDLTWTDVLARAERRAAIQPPRAPAGENPLGGQPGPRRVPLADGTMVPSTDPRARTCPECQQVHATRPAMRDHLRKVHGVTLGELGLPGGRPDGGPRIKAPAAPQPQLEALTG